LLGRRDSKVVISRALKGTASLLGDGSAYFLKHSQAFFGREQRLFTGMERHGDDQAVAEGDGVPDHVQMAVGDGIEGAGVKRNTGHNPLYPAPGGPASRARLRL